MTASLNIRQVFTSGHTRRLEDADATPWQGEISALLNLVRSLGGFVVAYFQVDWVTKHGALQAFGAEAGIVAALFISIIPVLQMKGRWLRGRFSM